MLLSSKEGGIATVIIGPMAAMDQKHWTATAHSLLGGTSFPIGDMQDYESALGFGWITKPDYVLNFNSPAGSTLSWNSTGRAGSWSSLSIKGPDGTVVVGPTSWNGHTWEGNGNALIEPGISSATFTAQVKVAPAIPGSGPIAPYWFLLLVAGIGFALTRIGRPFQFSMRTLLGAMTYVAVIMALAIVQSR
jgi:hypothetical protein